MASPPKTFEAFVEQERSRLHALKEEAIARFQAIKAEIDGLEKELSAIQAYVSVKDGKQHAPTAASRAPRTSGNRAPKGNRQQEVLGIVERHKDGITRGGIIAALDTKGNRSGEQAVSNALNALKKSGKIGSNAGRWAAN